MRLHCRCAAPTLTGTVSMLVVKSDKKKKKHYERVEALRLFATTCDLPDVSAGGIDGSHLL
jgi:hypothetical protein